MAYLPQFNRYSKMLYLLNARIRVLSPTCVLSPHSYFIPTPVFYPPIRVLSPPPSMFYPPICVLSPPPICVLSPHPCFIPSSMFYPLIHVLSPHPCFIPFIYLCSLYPYPCHLYLCFIPTQCISVLYTLNNLKLTQFDPQILISDVYDGKIKY